MFGSIVAAILGVVGIAVIVLAIISNHPLGWLFAFFGIVLVCAALFLFLRPRPRPRHRGRLRRMPPKLFRRRPPPPAVRRRRRRRR